MHRPGSRLTPGSPALGVGWMLDAFEVQIIGSVIPSIALEFGLSGREQIWVFVIWFVGIMIGALRFGWLADRVGRKRLFVATLVLRGQLRGRFGSSVAEPPHEFVRVCSLCRVERCEVLPRRHPV